MRGRSLPDRTDIVALALDREQHGTLDGAGLDALSLPVKPAGRQCKLLKYEPDRLQVKLRGQIEHGEIFIVEGLRRLRLLMIAVCQIVVELTMRLHVPFDVHAHEGRKLHEARIDSAECAAVADRNGGDEIVLEPFDGS